MDYISFHRASDRDPFALTWSFAAWNLFLSIFSAYGVLRTVPHLLHRLATESFEDTVCRSAHVSYGAGASGFAAAIFVISKIPELLDTVFLVLKKKEVQFLHWYHHCTVLVFCWNSFVTESAAGLWFVAMNYTVHSVMYMYFALSTLRILPGLIPAPLVTTMQILQMAIGTAVVSACLYLNRYGSARYVYRLSEGPVACGNSESNLWVGGVIYASYLYLFAEFAVRRYFCRKPKAVKDASSIEASAGKKSL